MKKGYSSLVLKFLGFLFMTIDHMGLFFFPDYLFLRILGRIAYPIFAFLLVEGFTHTSSKYNYFLRLSGFALCLQLPDILNIYHIGPNIFFTLAAGFLILMIYESSKSYTYRIFYSCIVLFLSVFLNLEYGLYGISLIILFYFGKHTSNEMKYLFFILLNLVYSIFLSPALKDSYLMLSESKDAGILLRLIEGVYISPIQVYAVLVIPLLIFYNGTRGYYSKKLQYILYLYYPVHLLLFSYLSFLFN